MSYIALDNQRNKSGKKKRKKKKRKKKKIFADFVVDIVLDNIYIVPYKINKAQENNQTTALCMLFLID